MLRPLIRYRDIDEGTEYNATEAGKVYVKLGVFGEGLIWMKLSCNAGHWLWNGKSDRTGWSCDVVPAGCVMVTNQAQAMASVRHNPHDFQITLI